MDAVPTTIHFVCSNCSASDNSANIAAVVAAISVVIAAVTAVATFRTASATAKAADASTNATEATSRAADEAAKEASASLDAISLTRVQMRRGEMPLVVPMASTHGRSEEDGLPKALSIREGDIETISEEHIPGSDVVVVVPIRNVGSGPALDVNASVEFLDAEGHMSPAGQPLFLSGGAYSALGASSAAALRFRYRGLAVPVLPFRVSLSFFDTYGASYESAATYFPDAMVYRDFVFRAPAELEPDTPH